jgi:cellulose biosynthesis protein BcsQ
MSFDPSLCRNESEVESKLIVQYLLPTLGYDPTKWHQEVALGNIRLDFLALTSQIFPNANDSSQKICVVMEAKSPKQNLDFHVRRLSHYLTKLRVVYGVLTNGKDFRIYEIVDEQVTLSFQCQGAEIADKIEKIKGIIGRDKLAGIEAIKLVPDDEVIDPIPPVAIEPPIELVKPVVPKPKVAGNMKTIAIYHNKGGVGKTTTVVNLAAALSKKGKRVLVIDLDSQANTTYATGLMKFQDEDDDTLKDNNIYHVILNLNSHGISDVALKGSFTSPYVDVVPAHISLIWEERFLQDKTFAQTRLVKKLDEVKDLYDVVLIDTPPSLNLYAKIALIACDYLIIPSDLKPFANEGLKNVKNFIEEINEFRTVISRNTINVLGVLPSKILMNAAYIKATLVKQEKVVTDRYGFPVLETRIFQREDLARSIDNFETVGDLQIPDPKSIFDFKPDSMSAAEFEELSNEILTKIGLKS